MNPSLSISIILDPNDTVANAGPVQWAAAELEASLSAGGAAVCRCQSANEAGPNDLCIIVAGTSATFANEILRTAGVSIPPVPEALGLIPGQADGKPVLLACGHDVLGSVYALLELTDRVRSAADPVAALAIAKPIVEQPANAVRSVTRVFVSDVEDKPWFNDREMWPRYLTVLAAQRFNRFNFSIGIGYDFLRNVTDAYFLFPYPFLFAVPGYNVRAVPLPDAECDANLAMLKFISEQTVARGLKFQLGLWIARLSVDQ